MRVKACKIEIKSTPPNNKTMKTHHLVRTTRKNILE